MVERLTRNRGSIGRRVWRRRRRKNNGEGLGTSLVPSVKNTQDTSLRAEVHRGVHAQAPLTGHLTPHHARENEHPTSQEPRTHVVLRGTQHSFTPTAPPAPTATTEPTGLWNAVRSFFQKTIVPPERATSHDDVSRAVLAVPRGVARLDAFERALHEATPNTPALRALAIAFETELRALADHAGIDLTLLEHRVEACARALVGVGEEERAGHLLMRVGRRHQAAELFVSLGAIDALEEIHAHIRWDEGGPRLDARLAFERFEALFVVHMRAAALASLERARALWHDNPVYREIHAAVRARVNPPGGVSLTSAQETVRVLCTWPVVIGRGDDAAVKLASPWVSRTHVQLERQGAAVVVMDVAGRGEVRVGGVACSGSCVLPRGDSTIAIGGVEVKTRHTEQAVELWPAVNSTERTLAVLGNGVHLSSNVENTSGVRLWFDDTAHAHVEPPIMLGSDTLTRRTLVFVGDRLATMDQSRTWTVVKG